MTVLPERSTRIAPTGTSTSPRRPTRVKRSASTTNTESSRAAPPSPVMRRAPSKTVTPAASGGRDTFEEQAARTRCAVTRRSDEALVTGRLLQQRRRVPLRHVAHGNARRLLHRLDVDDGDVVGDGIGDVGGL